ncbi:MAG: addiction module protein [Bacteroidetes bacterium]|nr:addiction module protein [Bacteroidota bacterium]MBS1592037.1 addiction module protein [Bacteroidota bacterium]
MTTEEKKKELQNIITSADDALTNILMEAAVEYQASAKENFVIPQEWIDEANQRLADMESGKDKGVSAEESMEQVKKILKEKCNVVYHPPVF